jgi:EAL domain-containing protein (putative c-di-GMP-specific phosphodiesterase class I)
MIIGVAKHLKVNLIAEGVETDAQMVWLVEQECEAFQGYHIDKP